MKWFWALVLVLALAFAAGLRIDFKVLAEKILKRSDPNVEALLKMGIDPRQVGYKGKSWWTFRSGDNVFKRFDPGSWIQQSDVMKEASQRVSQRKKNEWGPSAAEIVESQAMDAAAQARNNKLRAEAGLRDARNMRDAQQGSGGTSAASRGAEDPAT